VEKSDWLAMQLLAKDEQEAQVTEAGYTDWRQGAEH